MEAKELQIHRFRGMTVEQKDDKGLTLTDVNLLSEKTDYVDDKSLENIATRATKSADGFYHLIKSNCNTSHPQISSSGYLEMYLALSCLTCEIYMKSIIYYEKRNNRKKETGHSLCKLFNKLPQVYKSTIRKKIKNIEMELPKIENAFHELRYDYELNKIEGNYMVLFDLMEVLREICSEFPKQSGSEIRYINGESMSIE